MSGLGWQGVAGTIGVTSSYAVRRHAPCTGRPIASLRYGHITTLHRTCSPSRLCGSVTAGVACGHPWMSPWLSPLGHRLALRDTQGSPP